MATTNVAEPLTGRVGPPVPAGRRLRLPQLAVGVLVTAAAALGFVLWNAASIERVPVLALVGAVERGHVLTADDLRVTYVGTDDQLAVTPADATDDLLGRVAVSDLPAGALVFSQQFVAGSTLVEGAGVVGLALGPGQYPTPQLRIGDLVNVIVPAEGEQESRLVEAAEVVWVEATGTQGQRFISLLMDESTADLVAGTVGNRDVRLVLVARDGQAER